MDQISVILKEAEGETHIIASYSQDGISTQVNNYKVVALANINTEMGKVSILDEPTYKININCITSMDLSNCNLHELPSSLKGLLLTQLNLSKNCLAGVPDCVTYGLRLIEKLDLSHNYIRNFDEEPRSATRLRLLKINNNLLQSIPLWILKVKCFNLEDLYYSHNIAAGFSKSQFERVSSYALKRAELRNCDLISADLKCIQSIRTLEYLNLSNVKGCKKLPNTFCNIDLLFEQPKFSICLQTLVLNNLGISSLPETVSCLLSLRELHLRDNVLLWIPESIVALQNLEVLDLSSNEIIYLPEAIAALSKLKVLRAAYNHIESLPESNSPTRLETLDLYYNKIRSFNLMFFDSVECIDLEQNYIETAAIEGAHYPKKKKLLREHISSEHRVDGPRVQLETTTTDGDSSSEDSVLSEPVNYHGEYEHANENEDDEDWWNDDEQTVENCCSSSDNEWMGSEVRCQKPNTTTNTIVSLNNEWFLFEDAIE